MIWEFLVTYKTLLLVVTGIVVAVATLAKTFHQFSLWLTKEPFDQPILLALHSRESLGAAQGTMLLDITLSYEGDQTLLFDRVDVRHWPGWLLTTSTGQLLSKGKYSFGFKYNTHTKHSVNPPLVLNPKSASLLRFEIELVPEGQFPSSGGSTQAKLFYRTGRGKTGAIPLLNIDAYKEYPDAYTAIRRKQAVPFPLFSAAAGDKTEVFRLTPAGAVRGKPVKPE